MHLLARSHCDSVYASHHPSSQSVSVRTYRHRQSASTYGTVRSLNDRAASVTRSAWRADDGRFCFTDKHRPTWQLETRRCNKVSRTSGRSLSVLLIMLARGLRHDATYFSLESARFPSRLRRVASTHATQGGSWDCSPSLASGRHSEWGSVSSSFRNGSASRSLLGTWAVPLRPPAALASFFFFLSQNSLVFPGLRNREIGAVSPEVRLDLLPLFVCSRAPALPKARETTMARDRETEHCGLFCPVPPRVSERTGGMGAGAIVHDSPLLLELWR